MTPKTRPRFWLITVAAVLGVALTGSLGVWQMNRAAQKLALQAAMEQRHAMAPVDIADVVDAAHPADWLHRNVVLRGTWIAKHTVYLDNRQMQGKPGFNVVTPLQLEGRARAVLVERGWVPRNFEQRDRLAPVETPAGVVEVRGRVALSPAKLYEFAGAAAGPIRQNLDVAAFRAETGLPLANFTVQQTGAASEGLLRDWPLPSSGVERNYGYAFQWWAIAFLIAALYAWFQFIAPSRAKGRHA